MIIFQNIIVLNGLSKNITFVQKWKLQFVKSFSWFPKETDKKSKLKNFPSSSLTLEPREPLAVEPGVVGCRISWKFLNANFSKHYGADWIKKENGKINIKENEIIDSWNKRGHFMIYNVVAIPIFIIYLQTACEKWESAKWLSKHAYLTHVPNIVVCPYVIKP